MAQKLMPAFQLAKQNSSKLKLKCGRNLVYSEYGAPNGFPLIHFHGAFSSRLEPRGFSDTAYKRNIRIICADRPGAGLSDIDPNITYESFSNDTEQLINHLNIEPGSFGFSGISQGGSYVLSHLYYLKRLKPRIGVLISSVSQVKSNEIKQKDIDEALKNCPDITTGAKLAYNYPSLFYLKLKLIDVILKYAPQLFNKQVKAFSSSKADAALFADTQRTELFIESMKYSLHKHGVKGWIKMSENTYNEWGFNLRDIDLDSVQILGYHGSDDTLCPIEWHQLIADKLQYEIKVFENEGHLMAFHDHVVNDIFDDITEHLKMTTKLY